MRPVSTTGRWRVPWIEALPDGWQFLSAKRLFQARTELAPVDAPQLAATQAYGVIEQAEYERRVGRKVTKLNKNLDKRRLVKRDDFIISMRSFEGGLERAWAEGGIRSSYVVLMPTAEINVGYYQHLFKSQPYIQALRATGNFIRDGQDLNYFNFSLVDLPYPPVADQALIARYLDWHGAMAGKLIRTKRRLIALLNEQKQSIIHRAVTRGLDPTSKLKPSGVDWLGDVPEHWEVKRLRDTVRSIIGGVWGDDPRGDADVACVRVADFDRNKLSVATIPPTLRSFSPSELSGRILERGDLLIEKSGGGDAQSVGCVVIYESEARAVCSNFIARTTVVESCDSRFLLLVHSSLYHSGIVQRSIKQTTGIQNLDLSTYMNERLALPPLEEQALIVSSIGEATAEIDAAMDVARNEIALIQEFRTRLVADVVTGQLDVRAVAATLPDVAEADAADLTDDEDLDDDADNLIDEEEAA